MAEIRELHDAQVPAAVELLARGMRDDPMHETVFGQDANHRLGRLACFFAALLPQLGQAPLAAWEEGCLVGVLGFFSPGRCRPRITAQLRIAFHLLSPNVAELWRLWRWMHACEQHNPSERHWHVAAVAVDVGRQRRGVGGEMLKAFCSRIDENGESAFLETDKSESVRFYARFGFAVIAREQVLGTTNWWMRRAPCRNQTISSRHSSPSGAIQPCDSTPDLTL
jgi:GNAT superfamily N-acetyltransferase